MEQQVEKVKQYISEHLADELTLDIIAEVGGYSAYHFARQFKSACGMSVMEYVSGERLERSKADLANGDKVIDVAMRYGFDTHAGFTKAFGAAFGCSPKEYAIHAFNMKGEIIMENDSRVVIRPVCQDDVNGLWENVYSSMTPRQIIDVKIMPMIEREKRGEGVELVAHVDGIVVMSLPMIKPFWIPLGVLFDNAFNWGEGEGNVLMGKLLEQMKQQCKMMNISTLLSPQYSDSEPCKALKRFGFIKSFSSDEWDYYMLAV